MKLSFFYNLVRIFQFVLCIINSLYFNTMMERVRFCPVERERFRRLKESSLVAIAESYSRVQLKPAVHLRYSG